MRKVLLALVWVTLSTGYIQAEVKKINIYHWSGYLPASILRQFAEETGIQVNSHSFDSNEALYTKLKTLPSHGYDIVMPSSDGVHRMAQEGMLLPLDKLKLPGIKHLDKRLLNKLYDLDNQYSIPYLFSTSGLAVNQRHHDVTHITSWKDIWQPHFKNRLLVLDDVRELFSVALFTLGLPSNTQNTHQIKKAYEKLRVLLSNIRTFNSEGMADLYKTEELTIGMGWSGDIYRVNQSNPDVRFIYPKEGYILSIDNIVIPKGAKNITEAYQLINFLLRPEIAAEISVTTGYGTANLGAYLHLPKHFLSNPIVYPETSILERGTVQLSAGEKTSIYEKYWEQLKIEG